VAASIVAFIALAAIIAVLVALIYRCQFRQHLMSSICADFLLAKKLQAHFPVFFNLDSTVPKGSPDSSLGSSGILKSALLSVSRFRQTLNNVSKVLQLEKGRKTLL